MGKKKKKDKEQIKPWCYYCDRIFADEATLIQHQKSKHFKCPTCNRKLNTAQGLCVHSYQVHKETVTSVPGAKAGRDSVDTEIFGMAGIPDGMKPGGVYEDEEPAAKKAKLESLETSTSQNPATPAAVYNSGAAAAPAFTSHPAPMAHAAAGAMLPSGTLSGPAVQAPGMPPVAYRPYGSFPGVHPPFAPAFPMMQPPHAYLPPGAPPTHPAMYGGVAAIGLPPAFAGPPPPYGAPPGFAPRLPHAGGIAPLFPVAAAAAASAPPAAPLFPVVPVSGVASGSGAEAPSSTAAAPVDPDLVWQDPEFSMEERRAQLPKYGGASSNGVHVFAS